VPPAHATPASLPRMPASLLLPPTGHAAVAKRVGSVELPRRERRKGRPDLGRRFAAGQRQVNADGELPASLTANGSRVHRLRAVFVGGNRTVGGRVPFTRFQRTCAPRLKWVKAPSRPRSPRPSRPRDALGAILSITVPGATIPDPAHGEPCPAAAPDAPCGRPRPRTQTAACRATAVFVRLWSGVVTATRCVALRNGMYSRIALQTTRL
jgi:hypothetical protein